MPAITVILLSYNEERRIGTCLDRLSGLDFPVFVVDSFSTDRTLEILKERHVSFVQHPFENYARQRNWAQANSPFDTEWVLHLDAGERLSPELRHWLNNDFDPGGPADGFLFSRRTYFMGRWIRYGGHYPNYHLRLFRRSKGHCEAKAYDQHFICAGSVQKSPRSADLIDVVAGNLAEFTESHARWALAEAVERAGLQKNAGELKPRLGGTPIERRRWFKRRIFDKTPLFLRAFLYFLYRYFIRLGFLDGLPGLVFHFLQGCWFRFLVDAMILEIRMSQKQTAKSQRREH